MTKHKYRLKPQVLSKPCKPSIFRFKHTGNLKPLTEIIGQERALKSLSFGLDINNPNYNIFLSGMAGTGKSTLAYEVVKKKAKDVMDLYDWCYVHNFVSPDMPKVIKLKAGYGHILKNELEIAIDEVLIQIVNALESDEFEYKKSQVLSYFVEKTNEMYLLMEEEARAIGFTISRNESGISPLPVKNGEVLSQAEYMGMNEAERTSLMKNSVIIQEKLNEAFRQYRDLEKDIKEQIKKIEQETASEIIDNNLAKVVDKFAANNKVIEYLNDIKEDLIKNMHIFTRDDEGGPLNIFKITDKKSFKKRYYVNLVVDNSLQKHAPIIVETNPTFANLFGHIEYTGEFGILATDFSKIKAGALHRANGGYLILNISDIINNYYIWETLKRVIKNQEIRIENISSVIGISSTETLQPEPIPCNVKVILIGEPVYYYLLHAYDEDFPKLFKIRADFDVKMPRNRKTIYDYARFVSTVCHTEDLRHFTPEAVAILVDYGSRLAENQNYLTTKFNKLLEIVYEANQWASYDNKEFVEKQHVKKAISERIYRCSSYEDDILELIINDTILINTFGESVGEINGLAVYQIGEHSFGKPVKITAKTYMGERGIINIERETKMSGSIHSKGVLTLSGYLGNLYAKDKPLSLSASLTFEQSYSGIEGDSASSAELYALLSSLAGIPLKQGIAVTGSVNQNGEIQPVGGVNEKITGYFKVCMAKGLDGNQGVIIPQQNVTDLMIDEDIIEQVRNRNFHIWAIENINQGLEILTDSEAGEYIDGNYTYNSVHYLADNKIKEWTKRKENKLISLHNKSKKRRDRW